MLYCNPHTTGQYDPHLSPTYPATLTTLNFFCSSFSQKIHHLSLQIAPQKSHVASSFVEIPPPVTPSPSLPDLHVQKSPVDRISVGNLLIAFSGNVDGTTPFRGADCGICAAGQEQEPYSKALEPQSHPIRPPSARFLYIWRFQTFKWV